MKNFILIFTSLFILTACGNQDRTDTTTTPTTPTTPPGREDVAPTPTTPTPTPTPNANEKASIQDKIVVDEPVINQRITSPLTVSGEAVGPWFFEASFPITLLDAEGKELAKGAAMTDEEWMTVDMVSFEGELTFNPGTATSGTLVLENDNPSGEADKAEKLEIPVRF